MIDEMLQEAQMAKNFLATEPFAVLRDKLTSDFRAALLSLINSESVEARERLKYISQLLDHFHLAAEREETIRTLIDRNLHDDY